VYNEYPVSPGDKSAGAWRSHPPLFSFGVKERKRALPLLLFCAFLAGCRVNFTF